MKRYDCRPAMPRSDNGPCSLFGDDRTLSIVSGGTAMVTPGNTPPEVSRARAALRLPAWRPPAETRTQLLLPPEAVATPEHDALWVLRLPFAEPLRRMQLAPSCRFLMRIRKQQAAEVLRPMPYLCQGMSKKVQKISKKPMARSQRARSNSL